MSIAALAGGGSVAVWARDGDIYCRLYDSAGVAAGAQLSLIVNFDDTNETAVIGLPDGRFHLVWYDDTDLRLE